MLVRFYSHLLPAWRAGFLRCQEPYRLVPDFQFASGAARLSMVPAYPIIGSVSQVTTGLEMFKRWFKRGAEPLRGAPAVRRIKTYSAQSGYVYQYHYEGFRAAPANGLEYVFAVSADRRTSIPVSVFLPNRATEPWEKEHGRELSGTERYAIAKMSLFQAFDERPDPSMMQQRVEVGPAGAASILSTLNID